MPPFVPDWPPRACDRAINISNVKVTGKICGLVKRNTHKLWNIKTPPLTVQKLLSRLKFFTTVRPAKTICPQISDPGGIKTLTDSFIYIQIGNFRLILHINTDFIPHVDIVIQYIIICSYVKESKAI